MEKKEKKIIISTIYSLLLHMHATVTLWVGTYIPLILVSYYYFGVGGFEVVPCDMYNISMIIIRD